MNVDDADPDVEEEAARLEQGILEPQSITRFLTLPSLTKRINPKKWDPIVNFAKLIILTSDQYIEVVQEIKTRREEAAMAKEKNRE